MLKNKLRKIFTGIEICDSSVNVVKIVREKDKWRLLQCENTLFPEETLRISYNKENIIDSNKFIETIRKSLDSMYGRVSYVGLSVPNKIAKISILKFDDLPKTKEEVQKMIAWQIKKTLRFPEENELISYYRLKKAQDGKEKLFVTIGNKDVLKQYELELKKIPLKAKIIRPACVNQYNFFRNELPKDGIVVYLGIYENYFVVFVFEDSMLNFCRSIKKGYSDPNYLSEVDRTLHHYLILNPNKEIGKIFIGSQAPSHRELDKDFAFLTGRQVCVMNEGQMISTDINLDKPEGKERLSSFVPAIGAAQSLAQ